MLLGAGLHGGSEGKVRLCPVFWTGPTAHKTRHHVTMQGEPIGNERQVPIRGLPYPPVRGIIPHTVVGCCSLPVLLWFSNSTFNTIMAKFTIPVCLLLVALVHTGNYSKNLLLYIIINYQNILDPQLFFSYYNIVMLINYWSQLVLLSLQKKTKIFHMEY